MSTADEMRLRMVDAERRLAPVRAALQESVNDLGIKMMGRRVCARRARKLRKRGDHVRFFGWTIGGKCRYSWLPNFHIFRSAL
jgi:hypothetical protein